MKMTKKDEYINLNSSDKLLNWLEDERVCPSQSYDNIIYAELQEVPDDIKKEYEKLVDEYFDDLCEEYRESQV